MNGFVGTTQPVDRESPEWHAMDQAREEFDLPSVVWCRCRGLGGVVGLRAYPPALNFSLPLRPALSTALLCAFCVAAVEGSVRQGPGLAVQLSGPAALRAPVRTSHCALASLSCCFESSHLFASAARGAGLTDSFMVSQSRI